MTSNETPETPPVVVPSPETPGEGIPPVQTIDIGGTVTDLKTPEGSPEESPIVTTVSGVAADKPPPGMTTTEAAPRSQSADTMTTDAAPTEQAVPPKPPTSILAIDIGGTKVKILATGQTEPRKAPTGKEFTPSKLVEIVRELASDREYEAISIGYPGLVGPSGPRSEPGNLGPGWVGFDFAAAFGKPVKMINDAAMQALGSYEGGRMLFLGFGTGLGSALIAGHVIIPLELGKLPFDSEKTLGDMLGRRGFEKLGKGAWREAVNRTVTSLMGAFVVDYLVIGGGNGKYVKDLPPGARLGNNLTAFRGGFRVWSVEDVWQLVASGGESPNPTAPEAVRLL